MTRTRALKPNHQERLHRQTAIDALLVKAILGELTTPDAALLAEYVRTEQRLADTTRRSLAHTTRALDRHREAADTAIREAEAAIERVRAWADRLDSMGNGTSIEADSLRRAAAKGIRAALDEPAPAATQTTDHHYLSTGCLHGDRVWADGRTGHQYCQSNTGKAGAKKPGQCKFCAAPCQCTCHKEQP